MLKQNFLRSLWLWMLFIVVGNVGAQNVAKIGTTEYATLQEAVAAATSGQTITLLADLNENVTVAADKNVIVDLKGNNITVAEAKPAFTNFGTLKIQGEGNVTRADNRGYVIDNQGTIELAGGNYKKTAGTSMNALLRNAGSMTISGGTYYAKYGNSAGTQDDYRADNIYSANSVGMPEGTVSAVSMTGGEFLTTTNGFVATATSSCVVTGGTFATAPHTFFADGYGVEKNAEGKYVTSDGFILSDGKNYYKTVEAAYTTATSALSLIANYEGNIEIPATAKNNYLYLNNHKVTGNITNNAAKALVLGESSTAKATSDNGIVTGTLSENIQVTGGKYVNDPAANVNKYEFKTSQVGGYYVVVDKTAEEKAAALAADGIKVTTGSGSTLAYYTSVQAAENACAASNYTMTLVADIENEDVVRTKSSATRQYKLGGFSFSGSINTALNGDGATTGVRFGGTGTAVLNNLSATFLSVDLDSYSPNVTIKAGNVTGNVTAKVGYLTIEGGTFTATGSSALAGSAGHLIIKGGTFAVNPTNYVAEGYEAVDNGDGTFSVQVVIPMAAQIGETKYETLAAAVAAVPTDGTATTITMLDNAELAATITTTLGQNIVLDLNGKTITSTKMAIKNLGDLKVTGTGNITVTGTSKTAYGISNSGGAALTNRAHLVVGENVTITAPCVAVYTKYGYATINGTLANTLDGANNSYSTLSQSDGSEVSVAATAKITGVVNAIYGSNGTLEVNSTNVGKIYADGSATTGLKIKKTSPIEELDIVGLAEFSDNADYYVAAKAISACTGTVKLLSDINGALALSAGKTVTLDLNGHKVDAKTYPIKVEGNLTITGEGTVQSTGMGQTSGTNSSFIADQGNSVQAATYVLNNGKLTILSGYYVAGFEGAEGNPAVYVRDNAVVEIKGGDFVGGSKFLLNKLDASRETSTIEVTGGTFHNNFNPADNAAEGEHTNFVAEGYESVDNGDGSWTVRQLPVYVEVHEEAVSVPGTATEDEKTAANAAVEELGSNTAVTADKATNVAEVESVTTLKIEVTNVAVATSTIEGVAAATITKVVYDVQPMKDEAKVHETDQPITFRLPVPQSFNGTSVKVSHKHNEVITSTYETVQGEGANKFVALSSDKFSEWTLEDVNPSTVAVIGESQYNSLAEAVAAATNGQTITMLADAEANAMVEISGKNITLDLNGKTISPVAGTQISGGLIGIHNGAGLTIDDSSAEKNGTITSGSDGKVYAAVQVTVKGDAASAPATLVVNNGNLEGYYYAIAGNGSRHNTSVIVNGGSLKGLANSPSTDDMGLAIYHPQNGTLTITGGTLEGPAAAVELRAGTINVTGGEFKATATEFTCKPNGSGTTTVGAALAIAQHTTKKDIKVTISGGTFEGVRALNESNPQTNDPAPQVNLAVTDGTFKGAVETTDVNSFISGGSFNEVIPQAYCALGFVPVTEPNEQGLFEVKELDLTLKVYTGSDSYTDMKIAEFVAHQEANPNAMALVSSDCAQYVAGATNVIVDYEVGHGHYYECEKFVLTDCNWYSPVKHFIAVSGSYSRTIFDGLNAICVPFDVEENALFTKHVFHSANVDGNTAYFNSCNTTVSAGEAFLAQVSGDKTWTFGFNHTDIFANPMEGSGFRGTYGDTYVSDCYKINDAGTGLQYHSSAINYAFRGYLDLHNDIQLQGSQQPNNLRIAFDEIEDDTTGISAIGNGANVDVIYNVQGLRLSKQQKGINILNGKKVLK